MSYPLGAHLVTSRFGYTHHGIYIGNGTVVHYLLDEGVTKTDLEGFSLGHSVRVRSHPGAPYSGRECARRAEDRLGEDRYNLLFNNCEHFATWCATGASRSEQVQDAAAAVANAATCSRMLAKGACAEMFVAGTVGAAVADFVGAEETGKAMRRQAAVAASSINTGESAPAAAAVALVDALADLWKK